MYTIAVVIKSLIPYVYGKNVLVTKRVASLQLTFTADIAIIGMHSPRQCLRLADGQCQHQQRENEHNLQWKTGSCITCWYIRDGLFGYDLIVKQSTSQVKKHPHFKCKNVYKLDMLSRLISQSQLCYLIAVTHILGQNRTLSMSRPDF